MLTHFRIGNVGVGASSLQFFARDPPTEVSGKIDGLLGSRKRSNRGCRGNVAEAFFFPFARLGVRVIRVW